MQVTSTEIQNSFGAYLKYSQYEDVEITRNGVVVAVLKGCDLFRVAEGQSVYSGKKPEMTLAEFLDFSSKSSGRYEFIGGEVFMLGSPSFQHQNCVLELATIFREWSLDTDCKTVVAPYDVLLQIGDITNVVQPDVLVLCDPENIDEKGRYQGVPTLVVEVLSETNRGHDMITKLDLYRGGGVSEYWIVNPTRCEVLVYTFADLEVQDYKVYDRTAEIRPVALQGLCVTVGDIFA
ncbi:MAG TPA: Uma2 family endonuclease [Firmicutes bacterium]|nr:Uma2 family endonuclease [Bacillota bacterium]